MFRIRLILLAVLAAACLAVVAAPSAHAVSDSRRWRAYEKAVAQRGCWYNYGAAGPCSRGYDCSGLVVRSYASVGIYPPRTTGGMLGWWRLRRVSHADSRMGMLAFFGDGHVELVAGRHTTFGALHSGTRVGWHRWSYSSSWHPTGFYKVRYAG